jgi:hypothetical protein
LPEARYYSDLTEAERHVVEPHPPVPADLPEGSQAPHPPANFVDSFFFGFTKV